MQQTNIDILNLVMGSGALLTQIFIIFLIGSWLLGKNNKLLLYLGKYGTLFSFLISLAIISFSFFYSEIIGYQPCILCLTQRGFFIANAIILGLTLWVKNEFFYKFFLRTNIGLSIAGAAVALYQYYGQMFNPSIFSFCSAYGVSCEKIYFTEFNYITFPMMALTAFVLIVILILIEYKKKGRHI